MHCAEESAEDELSDECGCVCPSARQRERRSIGRSRRGHTCRAIAAKMGALTNNPARVHRAPEVAKPMFSPAPESELLGPSVVRIVRERRRGRR